jgi:hypothetical protein
MDIQNGTPESNSCGQSDRWCGRQLTESDVASKITSTLLQRRQARGGTEHIAQVHRSTAKENAWQECKLRVYAQASRICVRQRRITLDYAAFHVAILAQPKKMRACLSPACPKKLDGAPLRGDQTEVTKTQTGFEALLELTLPIPRRGLSAFAKLARTVSTETDSAPDRVADHIEISQGQLLADCVLTAETARRKG